MYLEEPIIAHGNGQTRTYTDSGIAIIVCMDTLSSYHLGLRSGSPDLGISMCLIVSCSRYLYLIQFAGMQYS